MRKVLYVLVIIALVPSTASKPDITHTDFYQRQLEDGEKITFGVQFEDPESEMSHATAKLKLDRLEVGYTPLLDRQGDEFYAGSLGPVEGGNTYKVEIKGCSESGECVEEIFTRYAHCSVGLLGSCLS